MRSIPMRTSSSFYVILFSFVLMSCGPKLFADRSLYNGRDKEKESFVQTKDGQTIEGSDAILKQPFIGKSTIEIDGLKIPVKDIVAYQNREAYYRRLDKQFAPRFKKGLINMYVNRYYYTDMSTTGSGLRTTKVREIFYIQKGDDAEPVLFKPKTVESYVSDYAPSMEYINEYKKGKSKIFLWSVINTTAVVGGLIYTISEGMDEDLHLKPAGYVSAAIGIGGLVNGVVNRFRRIKNLQNVELAIDTYNYQTVRKKKVK